MQSARERIAHIASSFEEQDVALTGGDPIGFEGYASQLERARGESGLVEACVWGWAEIEGEACALVVMDFSFLGGSMGVAVGEKIARAFEQAIRRSMPVVTVCASGGARMQEGMAALVQMAKTAQARSAHARAGLAHVSLLTSPTTGGVYASFASLADVVLAERGATIGFAGPRVVAELTGEAADPATHSAEFAFEHGLVDALVEPAEEPATIALALRNLTGRPPPQPVSSPARASAPAVARRRPAWERLLLARLPTRPKAGAILDALLADEIELSGDRLGSDDPAVVVRVGSLPGGRRVLGIGQDSSQGVAPLHSQGVASLHPGPGGTGRITAHGYRKAIRCLRLAPRHGLPVVTLIDTRGADPLPGSEGEGVAAAVARTFVSLLECPTPTLAVVIGEGGSGGALAMACADRVIAWENAVFSVIAPEGAASILYRDSSRAPDLAERLRITAADLVEMGIVDEIVPEPAEGAQANPRAAVDALVEVISAAVEALEAQDDGERLERRRRRWRGALGSTAAQGPG